MLPGGTDPLYRKVLAAGHRRYARIEVWSGQGVRLETMLPAMQSATFTGSPEGGLVFLDGTVNATLGNRVARNLRITVPGYMYPLSTDDLLAPFGNEIRAYSGVLLGDGSDIYTWQVFRGRIRNVTASSDGTCTVECADRGADVADVNFVSPQNSNLLNTINEEFQRLIIDAVPDAVFGASDLFAKTMEALTWESERAAALDEMARSVGGLWYPLANGDYVIRRFPWTVPLTPLVTWSDTGDGATVNGWSVSRSRDSIYNVVTVTGERLNGDPPVHATAMDSMAGSPTSITGNFGVRSRLERLQTPSSSGGVAAAAEKLLQTYIAPIEEWTLNIVPDAALELGEVGRVLVNNRNVVQVATAFALPLGLSGDMTLSTRSLVVGGVI